MTDDEKLLQLLRKLDPAKDTKEDKKPVNASAIASGVPVMPGATRTELPDAGVSAEEAAANGVANDMINQGGTGAGTGTAGDIAQNRYAHNAGKANPYMDIDWVKKSRWGNYNNMSYNNTLGLSRLADAFNAQRAWFAPSVNPLSRGGEGGGVKINLVQNPTINTEEQRAMGINRQLAAQRGSFDLARQDRSQNVPITLEEAVSKGILNAGQQKDLQNLGFGDQLRRDIWNKIYNAEYSQSLSERMQQFAADLAQQEAGENAEFLMKTFAKDPTLAVMTAQMLGAGAQMPSMETWLNNSYIANQLQERGIDPRSAQAQQYYYAIRAMITMNNIYNTTAMTMGSLGQGILGAGASIFNPGALNVAN